MKKKREKPVCTRCDSDDVCSDAYASWDVKSQQWELTMTFEKVLPHVDELP